MVLPGVQGQVWEEIRAHVLVSWKKQNDKYIARCGEGGVDKYGIYFGMVANVTLHSDNKNALHE